MRKVSFFAVIFTVTSVVLFSINSMIATSQSQSSTTKSEVQYKPSPAVKAKVDAPHPSANAKQKAKKGTIGEGEMLVTAKDSNSDYWVEDVDLDGKGKMTDTQMLWDNTDKALYAFANKTMMCKNGSTADGDFLMAVYGKGNTAKMPAGSGWWMAGLDAGECGMKTEGIYGCKFDQNGNNTACGMADLNEKTNELTIIDATTSR